MNTPGSGYTGSTFKVSNIRGHSSFTRTRSFLPMPILDIKAHTAGFFRLTKSFHESRANWITLKRNCRTVRSGKAKVK